MNRPKLTSQDDAGLRRMARAVVLQAFDDLHGGDHETRVDAWRWLNGEHEAGFSFALCCNLLGRRPEVIRCGILARHLPVAPLVPTHLAAPTHELAEQLAG